MKNLIFCGLLFLGVLTSCSSTSKMTADSEKLMRGDWFITDIAVDGVDESAVNITVFDEADSGCFEGSIWHFVQNNATGNYTLDGSGNCPGGTTNIKWFVSEDNGQMYFNFKKIYEGEKPKNVKDGYKLRITSNTGTQFILAQELMFEGKPISIFYTFQKNS